MSFSTADVTVIVPCLNAEGTLGEALASVFAQTAPPREVLLIDDHSTDHSVAIATSFGPAVRIFDNPRRGTGPARELGVREARGRYIAFVDADDLLDPAKHERQLEVLEANGPHTVVHTGAKLFYDQPGCPSRLRGSAEAATGRCTRVLFERNPLCGASVMLERRIILEVGNYDPDLWGTDDFYMSLAASTCCDFVYLPGPLYHIRMHGTNMSHRRLRMIYNHWLAQDRFRLRFPEAFAAIPPESVRQYMVEPVLQAVREAYWSRNGDGYRLLLGLARSLAPDDRGIVRLWRRRWCPLGVLRWFDRRSGARRKAPSRSGPLPSPDEPLARCSP